MTQEIAIIKQENISTIVSAAPESFQKNRLSVQNCMAAGEALLKAVNETGMTDELDQQAASFIEKARKTVKAMNERRSPVTKLFDEIRREFTSLENIIDPAKADTVPYKLQQLRNAYAAKKRAEEEQRRRIELARQQAEAARKQYLQDVEEDLKMQFQQLVNRGINWLCDKDNSVTLDNYDEVYKAVKDFSAELPEKWFSELRTLLRRPVGIQLDDVEKIEKETKERLSKQFHEQFKAEIQDNKDYILDRLPSKKANLERIAQANAEEAARLKAEMEERQRKAAAEMEAERKRREEEERQKAELAKQQAEMSNLFDGQQVMHPSYQPKMKVSQKINLLNAEGIVPIFGMWWTKEGCHLSVEELAKMFKKQIAFCEKLANKEGTYLQDESVEYVDDVKAK